MKLEVPTVLSRFSLRTNAYECTHMAPKVEDAVWQALGISRTVRI